MKREKQKRGEMKKKIPKTEAKRVVRPGGGPENLGRLGTVQYDGEGGGRPIREGKSTAGEGGKWVPPLVKRTDSLSNQEYCKGGTPCCAIYPKTSVVEPPPCVQDGGVCGSRRGGENVRGGKDGEGKKWGAKRVGVLHKK